MFAQSLKRSPIEILVACTTNNSIYIYIYYYYSLQVLLEVVPSLLNLPDATGKLPLHMASISTSPLSLSLLVSKAAGLDCVDPFHRTPLHYAAAANQPDNVQVFSTIYNVIYLHYTRVLLLYYYSIIIYLRIWSIHYSNPIYRKTHHHFTIHFLNSMTSQVQRSYE